MLGSIRQVQGLPQLSLLILKDCFSKLVPKRYRTQWIKFRNCTLCCILSFAFVITLVIYLSTSTANKPNIYFQFNHFSEYYHPQHSHHQSTNIILDKTKPQPAIITKVSLHPLIYISIATLGDYGCPATVNSAFTKAKYPNYIRMGIYQQNTATDPECLKMLEFCDNNKNELNDKNLKAFDISLLCEMHGKKFISINRTTIKDGAKGPVYGRYMSLKMFNNETFILIIDSHTIFRHEWDVILLQMWYSINNEHAVLTHYPWGAEHFDQRIQTLIEKPDDFYSYHLCGSIFEGPPNYIPRNANGCFVKGVKHPILVPFFAGGFSFAKSHFTRNVPWDPYLLHVFNGEEFDISTRGWTAGYDFYSPSFDIVAHWYDKGPKRQSPHLQRYIKDANTLRLKSEKRILYLWGLINDKNVEMYEKQGLIELEDIEKYQLGNKRSLSEYWKFAGIDIHIRNITVFSTDLYAKGGLQYVPWNYA